MRDAVARLRLSTVVTELLLAGSVAVVTTYLIDLMPAWGWPGALDPVPEVAVAVTCAAAALVLARRVLPVPVLLVAALLFGLSPDTGVAFAAVAFTVGGTLTTTARRWVALSAAAVVPVAVVLVVQPPRQWRQAVVVIAIATVLCVVIPALVGLSQAQQARLVRAMRDRADFLAQARHLAESEARLRERSRIAGEMHDHLGHRLSLIAMFSGALETAAKGKDPELEEAANHVRLASRGALDELRQSLGTLWSAEASEANTSTGTWEDIVQLVAASRAAGIGVTLDWRGADLVDAPSALRHAVHRVVQEALTNVHKHAAAAPVTVTVEHEGGELSVRVHNGNEPASSVTERLPGSGHGLVGLRERVGLLGGILTAGPAPEGGFVVAATMPVRGGTPTLLEPSPQPREPAPPHRLTSGLSAGLLQVGGLVAVAAMLVMTPVVGAPLLPNVEYDPLADLALGVTPAEVETIYGADEPAARAAAAGVEPSAPPGSTCTYVAGAKTDETLIAVVYRFCYAADRLVDKVWFPGNGRES
jgi:signal transduction histidine kinase